MTDKEHAYWLADKIPAYGDYAKEAAQVLQLQADEIERLQARVAELEQRGESVAKMIRGVRVECDAVVVSVFGGTAAARKLCGALIAMIDAAPSPEDK